MTIRMRNRRARSPAWVGRIPPKAANRIPALRHHREVLRRHIKARHRVDRRGDPHHLEASLRAITM